ncbi:MAG: ABC transporter permease [Clostridiales bacterium]|nr:ABC transporter permease [Clostridiales bacterium]
MLKFIIKRLLSAIPVLFIVVTLVFLLMRVIPGDPATMMLGEDADPADIEAFKEMMGLNAPIAKQYIDYLKNILTGNWGNSLYYKTPVFQNILDRMEPTILITLYSTVLSVIIGIPFGVIAARRRATVTDYSITTLAIFGNSMPSFWLGIMMVYLFGVQLGWFPVQGYVSIAEGGLLKSLYSITMPSISIGIQNVSSIARYTRSTMLDVLNEDYVRTARAKGLSEKKVYYKHSLKNSLAPVVTLVGFSIAGMLGGSVVSETVFNIPGMGKLAYDSLMRRDYPQEQAIILFIAIILVITNIILDIVYKYLDPRIELDQ